MAVALNDSITNDLINYGVGITSKMFQFTYDVLTELTTNWVSTLAVVIIIGALLMAIKKGMPNTGNLMPKLK